MSRIVHIVCLDAPSPPDYGGAIDMFYKIKALGETGFKIILHYFDYRTGRNAGELDKYCLEINRYKRSSFFQSKPYRSPYIIQSRVNNDLVRRLNSDAHPILLEGLHCAGVIPYITNKERCVLRMHNEEAAYYRHLADTETSFLKRFYYSHEGRLLHRYQEAMPKEIRLACLSAADMDVFSNTYHFRQLAFIPCFLPWQMLTSTEGKGDFCLYHGNLSVSENNKAALWLIDEVFSSLDIPLIIAGKGASKELLQRSENNSHIRVVNNPSIAEIDTLVKRAQVNVLPSMNNTGVKLKLLNALFNGRFCMTNKQGVAGSGIEKGVLVPKTTQEWMTSLPLLMNRPFTARDRDERSVVLAVYNNHENAAKLSELWSHCQ